MVDLKRIGEFIAACRREKKLTQKQLGEKLNVTDRAADSLYSFYFWQEQYEKAEQYLACFSGHDPERKRKQAQIYRKTGRTQEAYQILEELLFSYFQLVSASLHGLYMLSAEDGDLEQAHLLVKKEKLLARLFDMGEYYEASAGLDLAVLEKDEAEVLEAAEKMLSGIMTIRSFTESPLYRHMDFRKAEEGFLAELKQNLLNCFRDEETYGFMRKNEKWKRLIETNGRLME